MLDSLLQLHEEISALLVTNNQYERIAQRIERIAQIKTVVAFLKIFKDVTNNLESDNSTPWSVRLIEHYQTASFEPLFSEVANVCDSHLEELIGTSDTSAKPLHMMRMSHQQPKNKAQPQTDSWTGKMASLTFQCQCQ